MDIIISKPLRNFTRSLGMPRGLKAFAYAKCNHFSYDNWFMFHALILFFILFC
jgi:hypothetical protein